MQWIAKVTPVYVMIVASLLMSGVMSEMELTKELEDHILQLHNDYRAQEGASNMAKLKWNNTLATQAQSWARGCVFKHSHMGSGENLAWNGNPKMDPVALINNSMERFYDEKKMYSYGQESCGSACHYTQMTWAKTTQVGCATTKCSSLANSRYSGAAWYLVCRYEPMGNMNKKKPFERGAACSACQNEGASCDQGLCEGGVPKKIPCVDDDPQCPEWAARPNECQVSNKEFMLESCKKSCNVCQP